jgi:hypothetical protein
MAGAYHDSLDDDPATPAYDAGGVVMPTGIRAGDQQHEIGVRRGLDECDSQLVRVVWEDGKDPYVATGLARQPWSMSEFVSGSSPFARIASAGRSSSPVGRIATRTGRRTVTCVTPAAAAAARSNGRSRWPGTSNNSPTAMSSPISRTCCQSDASTSTSATSPSNRTRSRITTASRFGDSGLPVSTTSKLPAGSRAGRPDAAPTLAATLTAIPSIAAAEKAGDDRRAQTGSASTRPLASVIDAIAVPRRAEPPSCLPAPEPGADGLLG